MNKVEIHPTACVEDGAEIGDGTVIGPFCHVQSGAKIGKNCKISAYCEIRENVVIGDGTSLGSRCTISAGGIIGRDAVIKYGFVLTDTPDLERPEERCPGEVGNDVLIGANVTLMPGVEIKWCSVIGACSQVRHDVPPNQIWFGNPAVFHSWRYQ